MSDIEYNSDENTASIGENLVRCLSVSPNINPLVFSKGNISEKSFT